MPVAVPANPIIEPFGSAAGVDYITLPLPVASQIGVQAGRASFTDGFPPLNFILPTAGGVPPDGKDFNGLLYMITAYCALLQAGQLCTYDAAVSAAIVGYKKGALLAAADGVGFWYSTVEGNVTDPDTGGAGWVRFVPTGNGYLSLVLASGTTNNYAPAGFTVETGVLDLNPTTGDATITGLAAGFDGQRVIVTNVHASNLITLNSMDAGSLAANRLRLPANLTLVQYSSITLQYSTGAGLWVALT